MPHVAGISQSAGGGLGRARVVSLGGMLLSFFGQKKCCDPISLFVHIDAYQFGYVFNKQGGQKVVLGG